MEIIKANGVNYNTINVSTSANSIIFTIADGDIVSLKNIFKKVTTLSVVDSDTPDEIYGEYNNLSFEFISEDAEGNVTIVMHIPTALELAVAQLQSSQADQDEAIAELYGMEG